MSEPAFTARLVRWKALLGFAIVTALLAYLLLTPGYGVRIGLGGLPGLTAGILDELGVPSVRPVIGLLGDAVLVLAVIAFAWRLFLGGVRVRVDEEGILVRDFFDAPIAWDEIERAWIERGSKDSDPKLYLQLREGRPRRAKLPTRLVWRFGGHQRRREVDVSMTGLDGDFDALITAVERLRPGLLPD